MPPVAKAGRAENTSERRCYHRLLGEGRRQTLRRTDCRAIITEDNRYPGLHDRRSMSYPLTHRITIRLRSVAGLLSPARQKQCFYVVQRSPKPLSRYRWLELHNSSIYLLSRSLSPCPKDTKAYFSDRPHIMSLLCLSANAPFDVVQPPCQLVSDEVGVPSHSEPYSPLCRSVCVVCAHETSIHHHLIGDYFAVHRRCICLAICRHALWWEEFTAHHSLCHLREQAEEIHAMPCLLDLLAN